MPTKSPLISVIIPVYNVEKWLKICLDSVISQTYENLEIIVVDDASPDNSAKIYNDFAKKDKRIKILKHAKNQGLGPARNTGMLAAKGEFIGFVDSDDYIGANFYELLIQKALETKSDVVAGDILWMGYYKNKKQIRRNLTLVSKEDIFNALHNKRYVWNKLYSADFLRKNGIKFLPIYREDEPFTIQVMHFANHFSFCAGAYYYYNRRNFATLTKHHSPAKSLEVRRIMREYSAKYGMDKFYKAKSEVYGNFNYLNYLAHKIHLLFHRPE